MSQSMIVEHSTTFRAIPEADLKTWLKDTLSSDKFVQQAFGSDRSAQFEMYMKFVEFLASKMLKLFPTTFQFLNTGPNMSKTLQKLRNQNKDAYDSSNFIVSPENLTHHDFQSQLNENESCEKSKKSQKTGEKDISDLDSSKLFISPYRKIELFKISLQFLFENLKIFRTLLEPS